MCNSPLGRGFPGSPSSNQNDRGWVVPAPQTGPRYNPPTLDLEPGGHTWEISDFQLQMPLPLPFIVVLVFELWVRYSSAYVYTKGRVSVLLGAKVGSGPHLRCEGTRAVCK